jgi:outer membrane protein
MKKAAILVIITLFISGAFALKANADETKFGFIDLNRALNESNEGKKAVTALESLVESKQKIIAEKENTLNKLKNEIASQTAILNPDALKKKQDQHDSLLKTYQRMIQDSKDEIQKKQSDFMKDILIDLRAVIAKFGKDEGYTAIFERFESGLLYMPESTNLTDKIIEIFNASSKENK